MKTYRVLVIPPEAPTYWIEVSKNTESGLLALQHHVGGDIEHLTLKKGKRIASAYVNEEGIRLCLPINRRATAVVETSDNAYLGPILGSMILAGPCANDGYNDDFTDDLQAVFVPQE